MRKIVLTLTVLVLAAAPASGARLTSAQQISDNELGSSRAIALITDGANALFAWHQNRTAFVSERFGADPVPQFRTPGTALATTSFVNQFEAYGYAPDRTIYQAWVSGGIQFNTRPPDGAFSAPVRVSSTTDGGRGDPFISVLPDGTPLVVWRNTIPATATTPQVTRIEATRRIAPDGTMAAPVVLREFTGDGSLTMTAQARSASIVTLAWQFGTDVFVADVDVASLSLGPVTPIGTGSLVGLVADAAGNQTLAYVNTPSGGVFFYRRPAGSALFSLHGFGAQVVPTGGTGSVQGFVGDDAGATYVVTETSLGIMAIRHAVTGVNTFLTFDHSTLTAFPQHRSPRIAATPDGHLVVAFTASEASPGTDAALAVATAAPGANTFAPTTLPGLSTNPIVLAQFGGNPLLQADDEGNVVIAFTNIYQTALFAVGGLFTMAYDAGGPTLSGLQVPSQLTVGQTAAFSVTARDPWSPGGPPSWNFGDGNVTSGEAVQHQYSAPGTYDVTVTATDAADNVTVERRTVTVVAAAQPAPSSPAPAPDRTAPTITSLRIVPASPRSGTTATVRLSASEAASVSTQLTRRLPGRSVSGSCRVETPRNRTRPRCVRLVPVKVQSLALGDGQRSLRVVLRANRKPLPAGSYRLTATATDAAGNTGPARRLDFRVAAA